MICRGFVVDHIFDHLQLWTTWKQCLQEHPKASFSDTKAPKSLVNQGKNRCRFVLDVDAAGSNPVTPAKIYALCTKKSVIFVRLGLVFCLLSLKRSLIKRPQFFCPNALFRHRIPVLQIFKAILEVFFEKPFSLLIATQILRADRFNVPSLHIKQRSCLCTIRYRRCCGHSCNPCPSDKPPRVRSVLHLGNERTKAHFYLL